MANLFNKMFHITNAPTVPPAEDENAPDADEPPDERISELPADFKKEKIYTRTTSVPAISRRESLLTRAIQAVHDPLPTSPHLSGAVRGLSTASSHSFASTAELTSDIESPARSASPSPPPQMNRLLIATPIKPVENGKVVIAPLCKDDKPAVMESGEAAVEKSLGRKRCIMFACRDALSEKPKEEGTKPHVEDAPKPEAAPRKSRITFACPSKHVETSTIIPVTADPARRQSSPVPRTRQLSALSPVRPRRATEASSTVPAMHAPSPVAPLSRQTFHEFGSSHEETEEWVAKASELTKPKLTIDDCMKKENAIRKLGKEAEEEAEEEEREQEELENEFDDEDDEDAEDDFAPSDDGNESDDEGGFAESDSESDAGSEYRFWAPSITMTRATSVDNMTHFSAQQPSRSRASSTSSMQSSRGTELQSRIVKKIKGPRVIRMRPGTPELPDSTDFVCGTLDEDRPLEAAYISCMEQRRRERHILIPQDIDPSFPTTDPEDQDEDEEDEEDEGLDSCDQIWMKGRFEGLDDDSRERRPSAILVSPLHSPVPAIAPPRPVRPAAVARPTLRSPPPKQKLARSPPPRRLFDHASKRLRSPPPVARLRSPRGSPTNSRPTPFGITINHLAQRPTADTTSSLPHTPNPFFRNWKYGRQPISRITSAVVAPGVEELHPDLHVRGPVDIVIGLEKKRQKRKEKYWRTHCRKAAKEQAEKKPPPGRGVERMKELGLECAERTRGYGLGQPAQHVLSL